MQPRHIMPCGMGLLHMRDDRIQIERRRVDHQRILGAMGQNGFWDKRACIKADRRSGDDVAPSEGSKVGCAGTGTDEMDGHVASPIAIAQVASLSCEITRAASRRAPGPAAASAAASATLPVP